MPPPAVRWEVCDGRTRPRASWRKLCGRRGVRASHVTVARLLRAQKYSLRSNRKRLGGKKDPYRDRQFRLLGASATPIPAPRLAGNQRGHEEEGVGG